MTDRRAFVVGAAAVAVSAACPSVAVAQTGPSDIQAMLKTLTGEATPIEGKISLDLPEVAENGNTIPYTITVDSPMSDSQLREGGAPIGTRQFASPDRQLPLHAGIREGVGNEQDAARADARSDGDRADQ
jgi:hypothetical protein